MFKAMLFLHLLAAVFAIGPLVHTATTAARGIRQGDAAAMASSARVARIYSYASLVVIIAGFALMSSKRNGQKVAEFSQTWIWLSVLLWAVAVGLVLAVIVPTLQKAVEQSQAGNTVASLTGRVAASGGIVALIFAAIVAVMVYKPGR